MATFSVTDIQTFKRCRRKWDYSSKVRRNLTKVGYGDPALELGGLVHRALARWILEPKANLTEIFQLESISRIDQIKENYLEKKGSEISDDDLDPIYDIVQLGSAMMTNYQIVHKTPVPENMTFAAAEQEVEIKVPGTLHSCTNCNGRGVIGTEDCTECNGTGVAYHHLSMTLDGLLQNERDWLYVLEHKTFHPRYRPTQHSLSRTDQFTGYCWGVRELDIGKVIGVAYDGISKQDKPAKTGKYTKLSDLFVRTTVHKTSDELDAWGENVAKVIVDMANNPSIYPNVPWDGCGDCGFTDLCDAELRGEPIDRLLQLSYIPRDTVRVQGIREEE